MEEEKSCKSEEELHTHEATEDKISHKATKPQRMKLPMNPQKRKRICMKKLLVQPLKNRKGFQHRHI